MTKIDTYAVAANQGPMIPDELEHHNKLAALLFEAGVTSVRVRALRWRYVQTTPAEPDWGKWPEIYDAYISRGMRILVPIIDTPFWAVDQRRCKDPERAHLCPPKPADWYYFVRAAIEKFDGIVSAFEIWNEPDLDSFFLGDALDYLLMLNAAFHANVEQGSSIEIWAPSTMPANFRSKKPKRRRRRAFTEYVASKGRFDRFTYHDYGPKLKRKVANYRHIRALLDANGRPHMPIAITEINKAPMNPDVFDAMTDEQLAAYLEKVYTLLAAEGASPIFWWKPIDTYDSRCASGVMRDGLLTPKYGKKAAYEKLAELIAAAK